jgi:hypothetical protein
MGHYSFAFLSDDNAQCHQFTKCRETLAERFMRHLSGDTAYDAYSKPSLEKTRVLIAFTNETTLGAKLEKALVDLHDIEGKLGLVRTTMDQVEGLSPALGTVYLVEGSKRWQLSPPMFSLFLLILRSQSMDALNFLDGLPGQPSAIKMLNHLVATKYWKVFGKDQMINWNWQKLAATDNNSAGIIPFLGVYNFVESSPCGSFPEATKVRYAKLFPHWTWIEKEQV